MWKVCTSFILLFKGNFLTSFCSSYCIQSVVYSWSNNWILECSWRCDLIGFTLTAPVWLWNTGLSHYLCKVYIEIRVDSKNERKLEIKGTCGEYFTEYYYCIYFIAFPFSIPRWCGQKVSPWCACMRIMTLTFPMAFSQTCKRWCTAPESSRPARRLTRIPQRTWQSSGISRSGVSAMAVIEAMVSIEIYIGNLKAKFPQAMKSLRM